MFCRFGSLATKKNSKEIDCCRGDFVLSKDVINRIILQGGGRKILVRGQFHNVFWHSMDTLRDKIIR